VLRDDPAATALPTLAPVLGHADVLALQRVAASIKFHDALVSYVLEIAAATATTRRSRSACRRAARSRCAAPRRARALLDGRDYCIPEDVQDLVVDVLAHRIALDGRTGYRAAAEESACLLREILDRISVPL
jgi:MoxR-like ATPase